MSKLSTNEGSNVNSSKKKRQAMSKRKKIIVSIAVSLSTIILIAALIIAYQIKSSIDVMIIPTNETNPIDETTIESLTPNPQNIVEEKADFKLLVMGLDYRGEHNALLTDSIMVFHIIPQQSSVKLLSIPRDLLVENTSGHTVKINSLFSEGYYQTNRQVKKDPSMLTGDTVQLGTIELDKAVLSGAMANTRSKLEEMLDIEIDYTTIVNFDTIISLVDEIGGIEIDVKRSMKYRPTNLYLEPGLQTLMGEDALGYARFREDDRGSRYYASDFERGKQQQEVVKALANEILSWSNMTKALKLLEIVSANVKMDMNYSDMYTMITQYYNTFNGESFSSIPFPEHYSAEGDVIIPDEALQALQAELKIEQP